MVAGLAPCGRAVLGRLGWAGVEEKKGGSQVGLEGNEMASRPKARKGGEREINFFFFFQIKFPNLFSKGF